MPTFHDHPRLLSCGSCGATTPTPPPGRFASLWDQGWRWKGQFEGLLKLAADSIAYSCPQCPPLF